MKHHIKQKKVLPLSPPHTQSFFSKFDSYENIFAIFIFIFGKKLNANTADNSCNIKSKF